MSFKQESKFDPSKNFTSVKIGTKKPVLETELNEMQQIQNEARADLVRQTIHSGFLQLSELEFLTDPLNSFSFKTEQEVNVNGYTVKIPAGTVITLDEPPEEGERDDLVFLEAWFEEVKAEDDSSIIDNRIGVETSRREKLNWRIRTFSGFEKETMREDTDILGYPTPERLIPQAQGALDAPLDYDYGNLWTHSIHRYGMFYGSRRRKSTGNVNKRNHVEDVGLYIAGEGTQTSKGIVKTTDGYVYAVPMFRVKRRNSGGYSVENGNGARIRIGSLTLTFDETLSGVGLGEEVVRKIVEGTTHIRVGDVLGTASTHRAVITEVLDSERVRILKTSSESLMETAVVHPAPDRPDGMFANVIAERDIIDLRHKVSLTGFNYEQLLEENFDKLLRGELQTKEKTKMLKTYHGIRKTPIDSNTVFYASFDGTTVAEVGNLGNALQTIQKVYVPSPTGNALNIPSSLGFNERVVDLSKTYKTGVVSLDFFVEAKALFERLSNFVNLGSSDGYRVTHNYIHGTGRFDVNESYGYLPDREEILKHTFVHIRSTVDLDNKTRSVYLNGKKIVSDRALPESFGNDVRYLVLGGIHKSSGANISATLDITLFDF